MRVLITTVPFADKDQLPLTLLENAGIEYVINPLNRKLTAEQLADMIHDYDVLIAGTEDINETVLAKAGNLKFISRVGIGLNSVNLEVARKMNIKVSYTADAPTAAVADLTLGLMLSLCRSTHIANMQMHQGYWHRYFGRRLSELTIGLIGVGRIGSMVLHYLSGFNPKNILVNDIDPIQGASYSGLTPKWVSKEEIYEKADLVSLHLPLNRITQNMIRKEQLLSMKSDSLVINTSRGGIINENDLYEVMTADHLGGAAIDVFEQEPYKGPLQQIERCILTSHMGSMSLDCRTRMEIEATEEAIRFIKGELLMNEVPENEYEAQLM